MDSVIPFNRKSSTGRRIATPASTAVLRFLRDPGLLTTWILRCRGGPDQRAISGLWCWAKTALSPAQTRPRSGTFCS